MLLVVLGLLGIFGIIMLASDDSDDKKEYERWAKLVQSNWRYTKLDKNTIKSLYCIAPERWRYEKSMGSVPFIFYKDEMHLSGVYIYTSYNDYLWLQAKFEKYKKQEEAKEEQRNIEARKRKENNSLEVILKTAQKDIDILKAQADKEIQQACDIQNKVVENLRKI